MNIKKINQEVLKELFKNNTRMVVAKDDEAKKIIVTTAGYIAYFIDNEDFKIRLDSCKNIGWNVETLISKDIASATKIEHYSKAGVKRNNGKIIEDVVRISNDKNSGYYNAKLLENFEKNAEYKLQDKKYPTLHIYEDGKIVGICVPLRIDED